MEGRWIFFELSCLIHIPLIVYNLFFYRKTNGAAFAISVKLFCMVLQKLKGEEIMNEHGDGAQIRSTVWNSGA